MTLTVPNLPGHQVLAVYYDLIVTNTHIRNNWTPIRPVDSTLPLRSIDRQVFEAGVVMERSAGDTPIGDTGGDSSTGSGSTTGSIGVTETEMLAVPLEQVVTEGVLIRTTSTTVTAMQHTFAHTEDALTFNFRSRVPGGDAGKQWGIDNVVVHYAANPMLSFSISPPTGDPLTFGLDMDSPPIELPFNGDRDEQNTQEGGQPVDDAGRDEDVVHFGGHRILDPDPDTHADDELLAVELKLSLPPGRNGETDGQRVVWGLTIPSSVKLWQWWGAPGNAEGDPVHPVRQYAHWGAAISGDYSRPDDVNNTQTRPYLYRLEGVRADQLARIQWWASNANDTGVPQDGNPQMVNSFTPAETRYLNAQVGPDLWPQWESVATSEFLSGTWIELENLDDEPGGIFDPYKPITATYRRSSSDTSTGLIMRFIVFTSPNGYPIPEQDYYIEGATRVGNGLYEFEIPQGEMTAALEFVPFMAGLWDGSKAIFTELISVRDHLGQTLETARDKLDNPDNIADIYIDYAGDTPGTSGREQLDVADGDTLIAYLSVGVPISEIGITGHGSSAGMVLDNNHNLVVNRGRVLIIDSSTGREIDLTHRLNQAMVAGAVLKLQGCNTAATGTANPRFPGDGSLAEDVSSLIPHVTVRGYTHSIKRLGKNNVIGIWRDFKNGNPD
ncbi:MAG TPA: hypothetical protein PKB10_06810 [Tepidisphaeraceae bacterium]|nr:hypothetical protein [Tepidisphaeraceae bacterium]